MIGSKAPHTNTHMPVCFVYLCLVLFLQDSMMRCSHSTNLPRWNLICLLTQTFVTYRALMMSFDGQLTTLSVPQIFRSSDFELSRVLSRVSSMSRKWCFCITYSAHHTFMSCFTSYFPLSLYFIFDILIRVTLHACLCTWIF